MTTLDDMTSVELHNWISERAAPEINRLKEAERAAFQKYVDANEALIEAHWALEAVAASKMPGESRAIALKALAQLKHLNLAERDQ